MAVWQFDFFLVSRAEIRRVFGNLPKRVPDLASISDDVDLDVDVLTYLDFQPTSKADLVSNLLPEMHSWSDEAQMFGTSDSDKIELWEDMFLVRVDLRDLSVRFLESVVQVALSLNCLIVCKESGNLLRPDFADLCNEIQNSPAAQFVRDPLAFLGIMSLKKDGGEGVRHRLLREQDATPERIDGD